MKSVLCQYVSPQNFASRYLVPWGKVSAEVIQEAYACLFICIYTLYVCAHAQIRHSLRKAGLYDRLSDLQSSLQAETGTVTYIP